MTRAIKDAKAALRSTLLARRDAIEHSLRVEAAQRLSMLAMASEFQDFLPEDGGIIAGYWPIRSELDPRLLMRALQLKGYRLAFPRISGDFLTFHAVEEMDALIPGPFDTREPSASLAECSPDLILTPLLGFDDRGGRLGYGKGYYDRAFSRHPQARRIGLAFACQRVEAVPSEAHDQLLERVFWI